MKILYSILDHPERLKGLGEAGITEAKIKSIITRHDEDAKVSPANFTYVARAINEEPERAAPPKELRKKDLRGKWNIYRSIMRTLNSTTVRIDASGNPRLDARVMAVMSRKLSAVEPDKSDTERRQAISELVRAESARLVEADSRPKRYRRRTKFSSGRREQFAPKKSAKKSISA